MLILLDNAIKHSDGEIDVRVQQSDTWVEIQVQDYSEGIAPEIMPHIFDRFYRGKDQAFINGFGLGLPIAKTLVEGMGGQIMLESELGKCSRVTLSFVAAEHDRSV